MSAYEWPPAVLRGLGSVMSKPFGHSLNCVKSRTEYLGPCLLVGFLLEAIIAKSRFDGFIGGWRGHMILTVAMLALLLARGVWIRLREPFYFAPPRPVGIVLAIACAWAVICCIMQSNAYANLVFLSVFAANIYVCLYIAPNLVLPYLGERSVLLYALPIFAVSVLNLVVDTEPASQGSPYWRLAGVTDNATQSGILGAMGAILALWMVLQWNRRRPVWFAIWILCVMALLMTRTRASIVGWAIGSTAMVFYWARNSVAAHLKWPVAVTLLLASMLVGLGTVAYPEFISPTRQYLRASDWEELIRSRAKPWEMGFANAAEHPWFGEGPMARFSNTNDPTNVDAYDVHRVYCSTWLAFAQAYGILGSLLFALLCFIMVLSATRRQVAFPLLLVGLMFSCIVSSIGSSWVVSFGMPGDRATWLILGLALAVPAREHSEG